MKMFTPLLRRARSSTHRSGFTLIEVLVAVAVLVVLIVLVAQLTNSAQKTTGFSNKQVTADQEAQSVFSQMEADFNAMSKNRGQDDLFWKNSGTGAGGAANDAFFFYSEAAGYFDGPLSTAPARSTYNQTATSLVGYRVGNLTQWKANSYEEYEYPNQCLYRLGRGMEWDSSLIGAFSPLFLTYARGAATPDPKALLTFPSGNTGVFRGPLGKTPPYDGSTDAGTDPRLSSIISESTFRLEFCFQLKDGSYSNFPILQTPTKEMGWQSSANFYKKQSVPPTVTDDSSPNKKYAVGSRWVYNDANNQRGFICISSTPKAAKWAPIGMKDVSAVVVGLAILEKNSRKIIKAGPSAGYPMDPNVYKQLVNAFQDVTDTDLTQNPPTLMGEKWVSKINSSSFINTMKTAGIPPASASQIRVYQRAFYLNTK